jgi:hypothetical protein
MDKKSLIRLSIILIICIVIFGLIKLVHILKKPKLESLQIDKTKITKVELIRPKEGNVTFVKEFDKWKLVVSSADKTYTYSGDTKLVGEVIDKISNIKLSDIISEDKNRFGEFYVDTSSGITIKVYLEQQNKPSKSFIIGKPGYDYSHYYFRYLDRNEIWLSSGLERYVIEQNIDFWRDKTILSVDRTKIEQINIVYANKKDNVNILSKGTTWYLLTEDKKERIIEQNKIDGFLNTLCSLRADGFANETEKFNKPDFKIEIKTKDSFDEILISSVTDNKALVKKSQLETVFFLYQYTVNNLKKKKTDF